MYGGLREEEEIFKVNGGGGEGFLKVNEGGGEGFFKAETKVPY